MEADYGTASDNPDSDGDGLSDGTEVHVYFTDPAAPDSDGDGDEDGWEVERGLDPTDETSHGYSGGWQMLTLAEKAALEPRPHPRVVELGKRIKRTTAYDQHVQKFDMYDIALQHKYTILHVSTASWYFTSWIFGDFEEPFEMIPESMRSLLRDSVVGVAIVACDGANDPDVVEPLAYDAAAVALQFPSTDAYPHLVDDSMELWAFLGRPEPNEHFYLLDDHMIVRAIDDFDLMLELIEAGPPPAPED